MRPTARYIPVIRILAVAMVLLVCAPAVSQPLDPIEASRQCLKLAERLWNQGYLDAACREYARASFVAPEWWYPAALGVRCPEQSPDARRLLERALAREQNPYSLQLALATFHLSRMEHDFALPHVAAAAEQDGNNPVLLWEWAEILLAAGKQSGAMEVLARAIETQPSSTPFLVRYARTAEALGRMAQAEWGYRHLATHGVNSVRNVRELAEFYGRNGCFEDERRVLVVLSLKHSLEPGFKASDGCLAFLGTH